MKVLPGPKPPWLRRPGCLSTAAQPVAAYLSEQNIHTVCGAAACPNCQECFSKGRATFLLLGDVCTRACRYCNIAKGQPVAPDETEPERVAAAVVRLGLKHVVLTSVTRDDLPDEGCGQFVATMAAIRRLAPQTSIEILVPDFKAASQTAIFAARPQVFNHNIEVVKTLFPLVRPRASFDNSLQLLANAAQAGLLTKSGFMVGLGESPAEVEELLRTLAGVGVKIVTIGQYLPPSSKHYPVSRYVLPEEYTAWADYGRSLGIKYVFAGPLVRSSYLADEVFQEFNHAES